MKITNIRTVQLKRPLERTQRNSMEGRKMRSFTFVIVETDAGISGIGDAFGNQALIEPIIRKSLANIAIGLDPLDIENLWKKLFCSSAFWEVGGSVLCAISAIEVACWDIMGKVKGVPVSELLGGAKLDKIEAYASDLHWDEPAHMADAAKGYVDDGFKIVKTHIGNENELDRDLLRLEAIRNAIGSKIGLMIDINTGFDRDAALEQAHKQAQFDPFWYEEPICPIDYAGCAWLREQLSVPIAVGENLYTAHGFQPMFTYKACDYIMPDILRCGGIEQTRLVCEEAEKHGVIASPHNYSSGVGLAATLHLMAALPKTKLLEFDPTHTSIYEELFVESLEVKDGFVRVPTAPGLGVNLTDEIIAKYS